MLSLERLLFTTVAFAVTVAAAPITSGSIFSFVDQSFALPSPDTLVFVDAGTTYTVTTTLDGMITTLGNCPGGVCTFEFGGTYAGSSALPGSALLINSVSQTLDFPTGTYFTISLNVSPASGTAPLSGTPLTLQSSSVSGIPFTVSSGLFQYFVNNTQVASIGLTGQGTASGSLFYLVNLTSSETLQFSNSAVPEPNGLALMGLTGIAVLLRVRQRAR